MPTFAESVTNIQDEYQARLSEIDILGTNLASERLANVVLRNEVSRLSAELEACQNPPTESSVALGCSERFFGEFQAALQRPLKVERFFGGTNNINSTYWDKIRTAAAAGIKPLIDTKRYDVPFVTWLRGFADEVGADVSFYHEPEDLTTTTFVTRFKAFVETFGRPISWNMMGQSFRDGKASTYYPGDEYVVNIGVDAYSKPNSLPYTTPEFLFDDAAAFAVAHGKPLVVYEFGILTSTQGSTPADRAAWLNDFAVWVKANPVVTTVCYWESEVGGANYQIRNEAQSMAAFRGMADDPYFGG